MSLAIDLAERGLVPDVALRSGIRRLLAERLRELERSAAVDGAGQARLIEALRASPIALLPAAANRQHYEVPPAFFEHVLGPRLKYSCCLWDAQSRSLAAAEEAMLALVAERALLRDGQEILDLGCGWGSMTLWMAERYPASRVVAVSNSRPQRAFIVERARRAGLRNVEVLTSDMNDFAAPGKFDRVVSIEMFEHLRNYEQLFARIASWLKPEGKLFAHVFCHRQYAYPFESEGDGNWMGRHFFTGGIMPSADLLARFQRDLALVQDWRVSGTHYRDTALAWLANLDRNQQQAIAVLAAALGPRESRRALRRWRMFFLACAELFGYRDGQEWFVMHYLFDLRPSRADSGG